MSFIVKGLRKPRQCEKYENSRLKRCCFLDEDDGCRLQKNTHRMNYDEQYAGCPIVAIPQDHGDIIDSATGKFLLGAEHTSFNPKKEWEK